jgi:lysophospholipase L1-like esterase
VSALVVFLVGLALGAPTGALGAPTGALGAPSTTPHRASWWYLALGDSVPVWNGTQSYPYRILAHFSRNFASLTLDDIAVSGATTSSMLSGGQYQSALQFLNLHRGHVALITIDIGGNDVVGCVGLNGIDESCASGARAQIKRNLSTMLAGLRRAAPHVPLFGMTYYNPFLGNWLAGGVVRAQTLATTPGLVALNRELTTLYGARKTADVQGAFKATDLKTMVPSQWGSVPIGVKRACSWLDIVCQQGSPEQFGDDPNVTGARVIASAFERRIGVLRPRRLPRPPRHSSRGARAAPRRATRRP